MESKIIILGRETNTYYILSSRMTKKFPGTKCLGIGMS